MQTNTTKQFAVRGLRLPAADAIAKIQADEKIHAEDKAYLIHKIQKSGFAGVVVDAHEDFLNGDTHTQISVTKLY